MILALILGCLLFAYGGYRYAVLVWEEMQERPECEIRQERLRQVMKQPAAAGTARSRRKVS